MNDKELKHYGVLGMHWGQRRGGGASSTLRRIGSVKPVAAVGKAGAYKRPAL
jgi:hypothetical protein